MLRSVIRRRALRILCRRRGVAQAAAVSVEHPDHSSYTEKLEFKDSGSQIDTFRVLAEDGTLLARPRVMPELSAVRSMFETMVRLHVMDNIYYASQRQGRITFYMTNFGEEANQIGSASALDASDLIWAQYREAGVLMHRGFSYNDFANQCASNMHESGKGRQMPVHYGSAALNFHTISSPLGTQIAQAPGAAYHLKVSGQKRVVMCYFGEGAASEGDAHAGMNFAAALQAPVIFFCRNNGYAISTPSSEQYRGDGIAARGIAYGIHTLRVDGNDLLAVHAAVTEARELALSGCPVVIEAMTYRVGHHSTSDDSTRYRSASEIESWESGNNPIRRVANFLSREGLLAEGEEEEMRAAFQKDALAALDDAEAAPKAGMEHLFTDVYAQPPSSLLSQEKALHAHLAEYEDEYDLSDYLQK